MTQTTTRGIDHIGLTVPNIAAAEHFLVQGLGAEFIYEMHGAGDPPFKGPDLERAIGLPPGAQVNVIRMYKVAHGPGIELFQYTFPEQRPPARACDFGWQHVALYVDDFDKAVARAVAAGAELMADPWDMMGSEGGAGNRFCFVRAPFGAMIELITFPSAMPYEQGTALRRWKPPLEVKKVSMTFCCACGGETTRQWYEADQRFRQVCVICKTIHYDNPKLLVWCFAYWNARLVLCRRAIEPALGLWNAPSGFVEADETLEEAASRETREETGLEIPSSRMILYRVACIPHIKQVWVGFRAELEDEPKFTPGTETLEVKLFAEEEIPIQEFAFHEMIPHVPHDFFHSLRNGEFVVKSEVVRPDATA